MDSPLHTKGFVMHDVQQVRLESLDDLSRTLSATARNIANILKQLESEVTTLKSEWTGEAALAYEAAQERWTVELAALNALLATVAKSVGGARSAYQSAEAGFASML
jgi:WXG100 family type VII secretion target